MDKVHSLTGRITSEMMQKAFRNVKRNRGKAGVDKVSIEMFEANLEQNLVALMRKLKEDTFQPKPVRRAYIPKDKTTKRPLGIPCVRDRVAQDVMRQLLEPIFTPNFHKHSFGFIRGRNCHQAIEQLRMFKSLGLTWVVDADIEKFFDNIPHALIMRLLAGRVADGNILRLVERFLKAGVMEHQQIRPTAKGTPQGGLISPLLANVVLDVLDQRLARENVAFVRYADDMVAICQTQASAERALAVTRSVIEDEMGLKLHPTKTKVVRYSSGFDFLGFHICSHGIRMRDKAVERFKTKIRDLTVRSHNLDTEKVEAINRVIRGTVNYYGASFATVITQFLTLDRWIRTRCRCMRYKRIWKTDRRRLRNKHIRRRGLVGCSEVHNLVRKRSIRPPDRGQFHGDRPVRETRMLGNAGNQPRCDNGKGVAKATS